VCIHFCCINVDSSSLSQHHTYTAPCLSRVHNVCYSYLDLAAAVLIGLCWHVLDQEGPFQALSWGHFGIKITDVCPPAVPPPAHLTIPNVAISSPNMEWVPNMQLRPFSLNARKDGRFGRYDPTLFPQVIPNDLCWLAAIPIRPKDPLDPLQVLWWDVTEKEFIPDSTSYFCDLGKLTPDRIKRFQDLQSQLSARARRHLTKGFHACVNTEDVLLKHTITRLQMVSCTFKDLVGQVAEFQRIYLSLLALLDYREIFEPRLSAQEDGKLKVFPVDCTRMGMVTTHLITVQYLFSIGIPVWYLGSRAALKTSLPCSMPEGIDPRVVQDDWTDGGQVRPFPTIYHGHPGPHLLHIKRLGSFLSDAVDLGHLTEEAPAQDHISGPSRQAKSRPGPYAPCKSTSKFFLFCILVHCCR
jgi:hypothetical protein